jgi:DnaB-like helicase C terminal domain/Toprim-like
MNTYYVTTEEKEEGDFVPPSLDIPSPAITSRGITADTLARYHVYSTGVTGQVRYNFYSHGERKLIGCKLRKKGWVDSSQKEISWLPGSTRSLFGWHLLTEQHEFVYICEGETDAMALSQVVPHPVIALAGNPRPEVLARWLGQLRPYCKTLVMAFDQDSEGAKYEEHVLSTWGVNHIECLRWGTQHKDIAEVLLAGSEWQQVTAPERPDTLLSGAELVECIESPTSNSFTPGLSTGYPGLDTLIGGYKPGKMILIAGEEKQGKTTFVLSLIANYIQEHKQPVLLIPLEMSATDNMLAIAQNILGISTNDRADYQDELIGVCKDLAPYIYAMKHFGYISKDDMARHLRFIPKLGVKLVVLDHITASATSYTDGLDVHTLDAQLYQLQAMLIEYECAAIVVSHVNASAEGRIRVKNLRGSKALAQVPEVVLGITRLERNLTDVYTVTPDRHVGVFGTVNLSFDCGAYTEIKCRINEIL